MMKIHSTSQTKRTTNINLPRLREKSTKETHGLTLPLLGLQQATWAYQSIAPLHLRPHTRVSKHLRLARDPSVGHWHMPTRSIITVSSEAPIQGLGRGKFSDSPDPSLWCRSPIGALETLRDVTHVPAPTNWTGQERHGSNHDALVHNSMGKSCWSLCRPYWHCTHDPGLRGAALGHYSLERGAITPWFTPPRPRLSTMVKTARTGISPQWWSWSYTS
jgi:hypothetical protein